MDYRSRTSPQNYFLSRGTEHNKSNNYFKNLFCNFSFAMPFNILATLAKSSALLPPPI